MWHTSLSWSVSTYGSGGHRDVLYYTIKTGSRSDTFANRFGDEASVKSDVGGLNAAPVRAELAQRRHAGALI